MSLATRHGVVNAVAAVVLGCVVLATVVGNQPALAAVATAGPVGATCTAADVTAADDVVPGAPVVQCVAERFRSTRGWLRGTCLKDPKALLPFAEYQATECKGQTKAQPEAIAQARMVAQLNALGTAGGTSLTGITPNLQWEVVTPTLGKRIDLLSYTQQNPAAPVDIAEVKVSGSGSPGNVSLSVATRNAAAQALTYANNVRPTTSRPVQLYDFSTRPYTDHFKIVFEQCPWDKTRRSERVYTTVGIPGTPGAVVANGTENPCPEQPKVRTATQAQSATSAVYQGELGADRNNNGIDDFLDFVRQHPELWHLGSRIPQRLYRIAQPVKVQLGGDALIEVEETLARIEMAELSEAEIDALFGRLMAGLGQASADAAADIAAGDAVAMGLTTEEFALAGALADAGFVLLPEAIVVVVVIGVILAAIWALNQWDVSGDPHLATLDGLAYDLQTVGEFHLLEVPSQGVDVQARFVPWGTSRTASVLNQVAFGLNGARVAVDTAGTVWVDDVPQPATRTWIDLGDGAAIIRKAGQTLVTFPGAAGITMAMSGYSVGFRVPPGVPTTGFLGNHDGKPGNDLVTATGEQVTTAAPQVIYGRYADSWRITSDESQFSYGEDQGTEAFTDRTFPDQIKTLADFPPTDVAAAQATCLAAGVVVGPQLDDCTFDVVTTGDAAYARAAAASTTFLQDPDAALLDANGTLSNTFDGPIPSNLKPLSVRDTASGKAAGPIFDASGYGFSVPALAPHLSIATTLELDVFGLVGAGTGSVTLAVDGVDAAGLDFTATTGTVRSGAATVAEAGQAVTPAGAAYTRYTVTLSVPHLADQLRITVKPNGFRGVLGTSLAVDNLTVTATLVPPQAFTGAFNTDLPGATPPVGAGVLENRASHDVYSLGAPAAGVAGLLVTSVSCPADLQWDLRDGAGTTLGRGGCAPSEIRGSTLTGVRLDVHPGPTISLPATYALKVLTVPGDVTAGGLTLDGPAVTMATAAPGQRAVATFTGSAGQLVALQTSASTVPAGSAVTVMVTAPSGATVLSIQGEQTSRRLALPATGTYTVLVDPVGVATGGLAVKMLSAPVPTAVSLTTSTVNGTLTATATANGVVSSADSSWIGVFDTTTGERLGYCGSGSVCTLNAVVLKGAGGHTLAAAVGSIPVTWSGPGSGWVVSAGVEVAGWSASVSAVKAADNTLTVTATTNYPVNGGAGYWAGIYDSVTKERFGYCATGVTCTLTGVVPHGAGAHTLVAAVGPTPGAWSDLGAWAISAPLSMPAWDASLTSRTATDGTLTLTATTNYPVNGGAGYWVGVYDSVTKERFGYCATGVTCALTGVMVHGAGAHTLVAAVGPTPGAWIPTGNWAVSAPVGVPGWSASLTSASAANGTLTLTATTNYPVNGGAGYWLGIYDQTTKARFGFCSTGTTCTLSNITLQGAGGHTLVAAVGPTPGSWSDAGNWAVSNLVETAGWAVSLSSATVANGTLTLSATTNYAVNGGVGIWVGIYDSVTRERFGYCSTGTVCTLSGIVPHGPGAHTFVAAVGPTPGSWTGTGNLAVSNQILPAAWSASLASTVATNGTLTVTATTNYPVDGGGGFWVGIYDSVTKERFGYCSTGVTCTLTGVVVHGAGAHILVAAVGPTPGSWSEAGAWAVSPAVPVDPWSASLASTVATNGTLTVTATTNYPVDGGGGFWVGIYDSVTKERFGYCSTGVTCTLTGVVVHGAGAHALVAAVGPTPGSWTEIGNWTASAPVAVPGWAASLSALKQTDGTLTLTATTNYPVNGGGSFWVGVYDANTGERFGYCSTGTTCALPGVVVHGPGPHTLVAAVGSTPAVWSPIGNWVVSSGTDPPAWSVALLAARATNGTWTMTATANYPVNGGAGYWLGIYDQTTGTRLGYCSTGLVCVLSGVSIPPAGMHNLVAAVGSTPASWSATGSWGISAVVPVVV